MDINESEKGLESVGGLGRWEEKQYPKAMKNCMNSGSPVS